MIKVNDRAAWERIPAKAKAPGYATVHKPVPWISGAITELLGITIQVGRTGVLTPVAELKPVFVQGSTVSRATLHNDDEIRRKDIRIGDAVIIRKAGMVIPEVIEVMKSKRHDDARPFDLFGHVGGKCPACGGTISRSQVSTGKKTEVAWRCENISGCPAQLVRRVEFFGQRSALDIEGVGGVFAEKAVERGLVKSPLDLSSCASTHLRSSTSALMTSRASSARRTPRKSSRASRERRHSRSPAGCTRSPFLRSARRLRTILRSFTTILPPSAIRS